MTISRTSQSAGNFPGQVRNQGWLDRKLEILHSAALKTSNSGMNNNGLEPGVVGSSNNPKRMSATPMIVLNDASDHISSAMRKGSKSAPANRQHDLESSLINSNNNNGNNNKELARSHSGLNLNVVQNMSVSPNTLPSIFTNLYNSLNQVQSYMNEPVNPKRRAQTAGGFFNTAEACSSVPHAPTVSNSATRHNKSAKQVWRDWEDDLNSKEDEFSDWRRETEADNSQSHLSLNNISSALKLARKYKSKAQKANQSGDVLQKVEELISELEKLIGIAKLWGKAEPKVQKDDDDMNLQEMIESKLKLVNSGGENMKSANKKSEKTLPINMSLPDFLKEFQEEQKSLDGKKNPVLADDFFDSYLKRLNNNNNNNLGFANQQDPNSPHFSRKSVRMIAEELQKKLDLLRYNPAAYEAFNERINYINKNSKDFKRIQAAMKGRFIQRNKKIVINYKPEVMEKQRSEKFKMLNERLNQVVERKQILEEAFRSTTSKKLKDQEDKAVMDKVQKELAHKRELKQQQQLRWAVVVILASKYEVVRWNLEKIRWQKCQTIKRNRAARVIQKAWFDYRDYLIREGKFEYHGVKRAIISIDLSVQILARFLYRIRRRRLAKAANYIRSFLLETVQTSKMSRLIQNYRRAVILAQKCFRRVSNFNKYQAVLLNLQWERFEQEIWDEKTSAVLSKQDDSGGKKNIQSQRRKSRASITMSSMKPKFISDDIKLNIIKEDLIKRRQAYWKVLIEYDKILEDWNAKNKVMLLKKDQLRGLGISSAVIISEDSDELLNDVEAKRGRMSLASPIQLPTIKSQDEDEHENDGLDPGSLKRQLGSRMNIGGSKMNLGSSMNLGGKLGSSSMNLRRNSTMELNDPQRRTSIMDLSNDGNNTNQKLGFNQPPPRLSRAGSSTGSKVNLGMPRKDSSSTTEFGGNSKKMNNQSNSTTNFHFGNGTLDMTKPPPKPVFKLLWTKQQWLVLLEKANQVTYERSTERRMK